MGRRGARVQDSGRWAFNRLAGAYAHRPPYPRALIERLSALASRGSVVDVGAGIGHVALPLAREGLQVTAVEPARAMLDVLLRSAGREGLRVRCVHAPAEDTGLPAASFALAVVADAAHWIDPELGGAELRRLLGPGGVVAVVDVELGGTAFMEDLLALVAQANPKRRRAVPATRQLLSIATSGAHLEEEVLRDEQPLSGVALEGVLGSLSHVEGAVGAARFSRLVEDARALASARGGAVWARTLHVGWAKAK